MNDKKLDGTLYTEYCASSLEPEEQKVHTGTSEPCIRCKNNNMGHFHTSVLKVYRKMYQIK